VRILGGVDGVGDRAEEALSFASYQRLDQVVAARVAAVVPRHVMQISRPSL